MSQRLARRLYEAGLLVIFVGILFHAPLSTGFGTLLPDYAIYIKAWKEVLIVLLSILAIVLITKHELWLTIWKSWIIRLCLLYALLHFALLTVINHGMLASVAGLMIDLRFIAFFLLSYVYGLIEPKAKQRAFKAVAVGSIVVVGFGLLQITVLPDDVLKYIGYSNDTIAPYGTIDKNPDFVRINSTLRGPNPLGAFIVVTFSLFVAWWVRHRKTITQRQYVYACLLTASMIAVLFATYSRSAYIGVIVGLLTIGIATIRRIDKKWGYITAGVAVASFLGLFLLQQTDWYANVVLHEDPQSKVVTKSNTEHIRSLRASYTSFTRHPFGQGVGSTGSASLYGDNSTSSVVENTYLFVARETGWLGLLLFLAIYALILMKLWHRRKQSWEATGLLAGGVALAVIGLLLPVWADDTVALIWWGLTGVVLAQIRR